MKQAEQINRSHIKLNNAINDLENKSSILDMQKAQGFIMIEALDREYKRANIKIENLNLQLEDKDKEIKFLHRKLNRTIFQGLLLVAGWTIYTGTRSLPSKSINIRL